MYTRKEIIDYRCPRWNDWSDIGLYMDQIISLLDGYVAGFYPDVRQKPVTSTMINNYVKQKILKPSLKKKYYREHLAHLYILFVLKPALALSDICGGITLLTRDKPIEQSYDEFCEMLESAIATAFNGGERQTAGGDGANALALAFAYTTLARICIGE